MPVTSRVRVRAVRVRAQRHRHQSRETRHAATGDPVAARITDRRDIELLRYGVLKKLAHGAV
jgi:hypothetical protein